MKSLRSGWNYLNHLNDEFKLPHSISTISRPALLTTVFLLVGLGILAAFIGSNLSGLIPLHVSGIWSHRQQDIIEAAQVPIGISSDIEI